MIRRTLAFLVVASLLSSAVAAVGSDRCSAIATKVGIGVIVTVLAAGAGSVIGPMFAKECNTPNPPMVNYTIAPCTSSNDATIVGLVVGGLSGVSLYMAFILVRRACHRSSAEEMPLVER